MKSIRICLTVILLLACMAAPAVAVETGGVDLAALQRDMAALKAQYNDLQAKYTILAERVGELSTREVVAPSAPRHVASPVEADHHDHHHAPLGFLNRFNPEISVIGDGVFHATDEKSAGLYDQFSLRQTEFAFSAMVDDFASGNFYVHLEPHDGEWHCGLCEGYITLLALPVEGLTMKAGKFKVDFGKINRVHLHDLPWVDYPNMVTNYLGPEGMSEPGVSASYRIPNPWGADLELTGQIVNNTNSVSFAGTEGRSLVYLGRLRNLIHIDDVSSLELGGSYAVGPNDDGFGKNMTALEGLDLTYNWHPCGHASCRAVTFQNEVLFSQHDRPLIDAVDGKWITSWAGYSSLEYRFAPRWSCFGRYDFSELPEFSTHRDNAVSGGLTFWQSDKCFWRLQYKHTDRNYGKDVDEVWLQCDFRIGPHRCHKH